MKLRFVLFALLTLALLAAVSIPAPAQAAPYPRVPYSAWGYVNAPLPVTVKVNAPYYVAAVYYGSYQGRVTYSIIVADVLDKPLIPPGSAVYLYCGGKLCGQGVWYSGANVQIDLKPLDNPFGGGPFGPIRRPPVSAPVR